MPRPIAAGVFGIARTIAPGRTDCRKPSVLPAMIEIARVFAPTNDFSVGATAAASCGLIAITMTLASVTGALMRTPRAACAAISADGFGSRTAICFGSSPSASQPSSMAPPILPAPTSTSVPEKSCSRDMSIPASPGTTLRLARGLEHRGVERLARVFAGPDHELKGLEIALAGLERCIEQRLALPAGALAPPRERHRRAEHDDAVVGPHVEMADPELLVDQPDQRHHLGPARLGNLEVEGAGEMQRLDVVHPGEGDLIVGPAALHRDRDLVVAVAVERPVMQRRKALDHVDRIVLAFRVMLDQRHARPHISVLGWWKRTMRKHAHRDALAGDSSALWPG